MLDYKTETIESIGHDPRFIKMANRVLDQNAVILRMNAALLEVLAAPPMFVRPEPAQEKGA